ncbi:MAG TPA: hypothetical protein VE779_17985 [Candidatus Angelobacter sp.]|nr:hypothetical protein [Candidatus Angelobacter sp.]
MRKLLFVALLIASLARTVMAGNKESGSSILKNVEPAGTTDKQHKKQQYDLTFAGTKNEYTCRTNENQKVQATQFVVGSAMTFSVNGNKGEVKDTQSGKSVKCTVVRVAAVGTAQ